MKVDAKMLVDLETRWREHGRPVRIEDDLAKGLINTLALVEVRKLHPHEETHMAGKIAVAEGMLEQAMFTWPILVDRGSNVILDGMHRWGLLNDFAFRYIPVQHFDYIKDGSIELNTWCRFIDDTTEEAFLKAAKAYGLKEVSMSVNDIPCRTSAIVVSPLKRLFTFEKQMSPRDEYYSLKSLEENLGITQKFNSGRARYLTERETLEQIARPQSMLTFPRPLAKKDVVDEARAGKVFPPKATRHVFLFRMYNISVPLQMLNSHTSAEELTQEVRAVHMEKELAYVGRGISIDRWYDEHMFKFI